MTDLQPCPFCGGKPTIEEGANDLPWVVGCRNSDCLVLCDVDGADTNREAVAAWNTRAALTPPAGDEVERVARVVKAACLAVAFGSPLRDYPGAKLEPVHFDAARQIIAALSRPNVPPAPTDEQVREAMQTAWDDFCDDAKAHPGDIYREGRKTFFRAGAWADHTAMQLRAILAKGTLSRPNVDEMREALTVTRKYAAEARETIVDCHCLWVDGKPDETTIEDIARREIDAIEADLARIDAALRGSDQ